MTQQRLLSQSAHSVAVYGLYFLSRLLVAVALGKCLSPGAYGVYSLVYAGVGLITCVLPLGGYHYYVTRTPGLPPARSLQLFKSVIVGQTAVLAALTAAVLAVPGAPAAIARVLRLDAEGWLIWLVAVIFLTENLNTDFTRYLYARREVERGDVVAFLHTTAWGFAVFALFVILPGHVTLASVLALWSGAYVVALLCGVRLIGARTLWRAPWKARTYRTAVSFGAPLLAGHLMVIVGWVGRFLLTSWHSTTVTGIFTYSQNIMLTLCAIAAPQRNPVEPYVTEAYNLGQRQRSGELLGAALRYRLALLVPLLVIFAVWNGPLIRVLARTEYLAPAGLLAAMAPVPVLMMFSAAYERVLLLGRRTRTIGACYAAAAIVQVSLYLLLVPRHPYYGPAIAADGGLACLTLLLRHQARRAGIPLSFGLGRVAAAAIGCLAVATAIRRAWPDPTGPGLVAAVAAVLGSSVVLLWIFRVVSAKEWRSLGQLAAAWLRPMARGQEVPG